MTRRDDDRPGDGTTAQRRPGQSRPGQRRALIAAGVVGLAAVLGGGAYLITTAIMAKNTTTATDVAAQAPPATVPATSPSAATAPHKTRKTSNPPDSPSPVPTVNASGEPIPSKVVEEIREAREKMAKDGVKVDHPIVPKATVAAADIQRTTTGSLKAGGIVRLVTAHGDLTGQGELAYVAGGVAKHRGVPCSQTFQFSTNPAPARRANLLMCWRTTASKSVVAVVVDPKGHPPRDKAVDVLEKKLRSMG